MVLQTCQYIKHFFLLWGFCQRKHFTDCPSLNAPTCRNRFGFSPWTESTHSAAAPFVLTGEGRDEEPFPSFGTMGCVCGRGKKSGKGLGILIS